MQASFRKLLLHKLLCAGKLECMNTNNCCSSTFGQGVYILLQFRFYSIDKFHSNKYGSNLESKMEYYITVLLHHTFSRHTKVLFQ